MAAVAFINAKTPRDAVYTFTSDVRFWGVKQTSRGPDAMSAFDPKRTLAASQCRDLEGSCRVPWSRTASPNISSGLRCGSAVIPSQVSAMFSQVCLCSQLSGSSAIRRQWTALARYWSTSNIGHLPKVDGGAYPRRGGVFRDGLYRNACLRASDQLL